MSERPTNGELREWLNDFGDFLEVAIIEEDVDGYTRRLDIQTVDTQTYEGETVVAIVVTR